LRQTGVAADDVQPERERWRSVKGDYVFLTLLENAADNIMERQERKARTPKDSLYSLESFKTEFEDVVDGGLSDRDVKIVLKYLERDKSAIKVDRDVRCFLCISELSV
jgi:charged multivesicular body protein 7